MGEMGSRRLGVFCVLLSLAVACSARDSRTHAMEIGLDVGVVVSGTAPISSTSARRVIANALRTRGYRVNDSAVISTAQTPMVSVRLEQATIDLLEEDGTLKRTASWLLLGPVYFWLPDTDYQICYQPRIQTAVPGGGGSVWQGSPVVFRKRLSFNQWSGRWEWYLISNVFPPFLSPINEENLTESLLAPTVQALARQIEVGLEASRVRHTKPATSSSPARTAPKPARPKLVAPSSVVKPKPATAKLQPKLATAKPGAVAAPAHLRGRVVEILSPPRALVRLVEPRIGQLTRRGKLRIQLLLKNRHVIERVVINGERIRDFDNQPRGLEARVSREVPSTGDVIIVETTLKGRKTRRTFIRLLPQRN